MFELNQLEQLLTVSKCGTLSKAAEELLVSQPALTRSMQRLENEIGVTLFNRKKNKIELNDNGILTVECAEKVMYDAHSMIERVRAYDRNKRTLYIGSCAPAPLWKLTPMMSELYPDFTISTEIKNTEQIIEGFQSGAYQLIITNKPVNDDNILCFKYCEEHLAVSLPPAHPLTMYKQICLKDLDGETIILFSEIGFWYDLCKREMPNAHFILQSERDDFAILVQNTALPSFVTDLAADGSSAPENRVIVPISDADANPTFYCVVRKGDKSRFKAFIQKYYY